MSILIKGMEMPKNCDECFFLGTDNNAHWYCYCQKKKISITSEKAYDSGCPIIELPPHGRLIDADAFIAKEEKVYCSNCYMRKNSKGKVVYDIGDAPCRACRMRDTLDDLDSVPTIIEAEVEE